MCQGQINPNGALNRSASTKIWHYRSVYATRTVLTQSHSCLSPSAPRVVYIRTSSDSDSSSVSEASALDNELPEHSDQFRFIHAACFVNLQSSIGLTLAKSSALHVSIPIDFSSRPFFPPVTLPPLPPPLAPPTLSVPCPRPSPSVLRLSGT